MALAPQGTRLVAVHPRLPFEPLQIALRPSQPRVIGVTQIELLPGHPIARVSCSSPEKLQDRSAEHARRQAFEDGVSADVEFLDQAILPARLRHDLLQPPDRL